MLPLEFGVAYAATRVFIAFLRRRGWANSLTSKRTFVAGVFFVAGALMYFAVGSLSVCFDAYKWLFC